MCKKKQFLQLNHSKNYDELIEFLFQAVPWITGVITLLFTIVLMKVFKAKSLEKNEAEKAETQEVEKKNT